MTVQEISFTNYRNLKDNTIMPNNGVNVIYGENAQGKTNLIESIWMFNGVRSFRGSRDNELISFHKPFAKLHIKFFSQEREQNADIDILQNKREAYLNKIKLKSSSQLLGKINSVVFSPDHLSLVKDGPSQRRKFLDSALCQIMPRYAVVLAKYNKILNQRNALLKDIPYHKELEETLEIWDEKLAYTGGALIFERIKYIEQLKESAKRFHSGISGDKEQLKIKYTSGYKIPNNCTHKEISDILLSNLEKSRKNDLFLKYTSVGPHRDDIEFLINGIKSRLYASQGQQRSIVLSLKLAEAEILYNVTEEKPIILLDDVLSELDKTRQNFLLNKIDGWQVFITCCDKSFTDTLQVGKIFNVNNGCVSEEKE